MKKLLYIFLATTLVLASCKNRKKQKEAEKAKSEIVDSTSEKKEDLNESPTREVFEISPEEKAKTVLISLSKSVCFGSCPAYNFTVFANGTAMYEGIKDVENIGKFKGKISKIAIDGLLSEAVTLRYFSLKDSYDNENVTDLPTATTFLNHHGKTKKVICRFDCDQRIQKVNKMIEAFSDGIKWKRYE